jgi:small-conductance mechanosensitive channel
MDKLSDWLHNITGLHPAIQDQILVSFLIIFILWFLRFILLRVVWRQTENVHTRYRWQKSSVYVIMVLGILFVGRVWFEGIQSLATYLGLLSAGLAIALKDIVTSLAGWIFIIVRRPFVVGDRIQVGEHAGDVIDIRVFKFTILEIGNWVDADQSTGRIIDIPNSKVLTDVLANYHKGFQYIWNEIPVLITFESNWQKAKTILLKIANKHGAELSKAAERRVKEASKKYMIFYQKLTPIVYTTVKDSGVMLTIRYFIDPRTRRGSEQAIWEDILKEFAKRKDIDFAYPTRRVYYNAVEGKEEARANVESGKIFSPPDKLNNS